MTNWFYFWGVILLLAARAAQVGAFVERGHVIADERVALHVEDVDIADFISSIHNLNLKRVIFPRNTGERSGVLELETNPNAKPKLAVLVTSEPRAQHPLSVRSNSEITKVRYDMKGKVTRLDEFKTVDINDLVLHSLGATQALVDVTFDLRDAFNSSQLTWQQRFFQLKALVEHLQSDVLMFRGQIGLFNETYKLAENRAKLAEVQLLEAQKAIARDQREREELLQNRTEEEHKAQRRLADYEDRLKHNLTEHESSLRKENDQAQELLRFESEAKLVDLRKNGSIEAAKEAARIEAEMEARQERENEDVRTRLLREQGLQDRRRWRELVEAISNALLQLLADPDRLTALVVALSAIFVGMYAARELSRVVAERLKEWLYQKPALVRETSRSYGILTRIGHQLRDLFEMAGLMWYSRGVAEDTILKGVVLEKTLDVRVRTLVSSIKLTTEHGAPLRHILFHGPPGTGKTMVARRVAYHSGLEFAIMSGGDVAPLKARAVTEIHKLVNWAKRSHKGMLLFIDEAEAFVGSRRSDAAGFGPSREALNALLYHTGSASTKFMMVLATNRPEDLDSAITDRIDDALNFGLPEYDARQRLIRTYFEKYVAEIPGLADLPTKTARLSTSKVSSRSSTRRKPRAKSRTRNKVKGKLELELKDDFDGQKESAESDNGDENGGLMSCFNAKEKRHIQINVGTRVNVQYLDSLADDFEGFSGREISKFMLAVQGLAHATPGVHLRHTDMEDLVRAKLEEHKLKADQRAPQ